MVIRFDKTYSMPQANDTIGPYRLVRQLGRGGFGEVWLAERRSSVLAVPVALKIAGAGKHNPDNIRSEARVWQRASGHPNVVPVLDAEEYNGQIVIASEYIAGGSLADWLEAKNGAVPTVEEAVRIVEGILTGLAHLNGAGVVHRDLKPENVLLQGGVPRLTDFGLSRVLGTSNQTENLTGSPLYMAPETFRGAYSPESDLWSVGIILYEMLAGQVPFHSQDIMALIQDIQHNAAPPLPNTVPEPLRMAVARLLEKTPEARYGSAAEVFDALRTATSSSGRLLRRAESTLDCDFAPRLRHKTVIPQSYTALVGREREIADLETYLADPGTRLVTLLGSGGNGKTRLAVEAAHRMANFLNGAVWFLPAGDLTDTAAVLDSLHGLLDLASTQHLEIRSQVIQKLSTQPSLLVIDNVEQLLPAGADLVATLLEGAPALTCLVTSQTSLRLTMEQTLLVNPLPVPQLLAGGDEWAQSNDAEKNPCVRLFVERARRARSDFALSPHNGPAVVEICRKLDGIPLAIELAASWAKVLTPMQMLTQLGNVLVSRDRDRSERHRSLNAVISASWQRLTPDQMKLLASLSVFRGGWTVEQAEEVCDAPFALLALTELQEASLIVCEEGAYSMRYRMLEPLREFAHARFVSRSDAGRTLERHRACFIALADQAAEGLRGPDEAAWIARLAEALPNIRAALGATQKAQRLRAAANLQRFWIAHGHIREGRKWIEESLSALDQVPDATRGSVLLAAGILAWTVGEMDTAVSHFNASLAACRGLADEAGAVKALVNLANIAATEGDRESACQNYEAALEIARKLGDDRLVAIILGNLAMHVEDKTTGRSHLQEALAVHECLDNERHKADLLHNLADLDAQDGNSGNAARFLVESMEIRKRFEDRSRVPQVLLLLAALTTGQKRYDLTVRILAATERAYEELGTTPNISEKEQMAAHLDVARTQLAHDAYRNEWTAGRTMRTNEALELALRVAKAWK